MVRQAIRNWLLKGSNISIAEDFYSWSHVYRPSRKAYIQDKKGYTSCVFCANNQKGLNPESLCLYKGKQGLVFLNKYPYNVGHLLVLPCEHESKLGNLNPESRGRLFELLTLTTEIVEKSYGCPALNVGLNQGRFAGAGLPEHLHFHVIPRWSGDSNFFPVIAGAKVFSETLEESYERLRPYFKQLEDKQ